jgi:hypothetical protein
LRRAARKKKRNILGWGVCDGWKAVSDDDVGSQQHDMGEGKEIQIALFIDLSGTKTCKKLLG